MTASMACWDVPSFLPPVDGSIQLLRIQSYRRMIVYNVWSGPRRLRWPDQGLVTPASPVRQLESPLGWSAVPQTVLRLSALLISSLVAGSDNETKLRYPVA
ncbi:hypothetical protein YC2023_088660 [Brassica napus]